MKQSDDSDATDRPPQPPPDIAQQQPPSYPFVVAVTQHRAHKPEQRSFGALPIHFRAGVTERFEREYCPHLDTWRWMESAQQDEPPCMFRLSDRNVRGCPTGEERDCGIYVMHRSVGHSPEKARGAKALPFDLDPKPDANPLRQEPEMPAWVNEP